MAKTITDGNGNNECEVSFSFNKYKKPELIDLKTSIANIVINALFMVPGNNPSDPNAGVDINSYLYSFEDNISTDEIKIKLTNTCGYLPGGVTISNVTFSPIEIKNETLFLLLVRLDIPNEDSTTLALALRKTNTTQEVLNFNFEYVDI